MMPNGNKDNEDGICCHQQRRDIVRRGKNAGKGNRQLISQGGRGLLNSARRWRSPLARGVPGNAAGSGSVEAAAVSIAGGGAAPTSGGGFVGATNLWRFGGGVWHVVHIFPPLLGWVQTSQAQSVLGKTKCGWSGGGEVALRITGVCVLTWSPGERGRLPNIRTIEAPSSCPPPKTLDY